MARVVSRYPYQEHTRARVEVGQQALVALQLEDLVADLLVQLLGSVLAQERREANVQGQVEVDVVSARALEPHQCVALPAGEAEVGLPGAGRAEALTRHAFALLLLV